MRARRSAANIQTTKSVTQRVPDDSAARARDARLYALNDTRPSPTSTPRPRVYQATALAGITQVLGAVGPGRLRGFKLSSSRYGDSARVQAHQPWL